MRNKRARYFRIITLIAILIFAITVYLFQHYKPAVEAMELIERQSDMIVEEKMGMKKALVITPAAVDESVGWIIYPGGKVDYRAYAVLGYQLAQESGQRVIVVSFPFHLAVFDINDGKAWMDKYEDTKKWYVIGHSLGGVMGAQMAKSDERIAGIGFLASYPSTDFSDSDMRMISIRGSSDKILNLAAFADAQSKFSPYTEFYVIQGGNHSQFGSYGFQKDDGMATVTKKDQIETVVDFLVLWGGEK
jgi:nitrous oxide reductase accessory protein NosL